MFLMRMLVFRGLWRAGSVGCRLGGCLFLVVGYRVAVCRFDWYGWNGALCLDLLLCAGGLYVRHWRFARILRGGVRKGV